MSTVAKVPPGPSDPVYRLSVDQYHEMVHRGIVTEDDRLELLEGLLIEKMTVSPSHRLATRRVRIALERVVPPGCYVDSPSPVTLADSEPERDVVVVRGSDQDYSHRHPGPEDLLLVVEVSDSSLRRDQSRKKSIYARAAIAIYWIVNLLDRRVEVYQEPTGPSEEPDFSQRHVFGENDQLPLTLAALGTVQVAVRDPLS